MTGGTGAERTLRELDEAAGLAKGSAFRAFKRLALQEGRDFRQLDPVRDETEIVALRGGNRVYLGTVAPVLLQPGAASRVLEIMRSGLPEASRGG